MPERCAGLAGGARWVLTAAVPFTRLSGPRRRGLLAPNRLGAQRAARGFLGRSEPSRRREM